MKKIWKHNARSLMVLLMAATVTPLPILANGAPIQETKQKPLRDYLNKSYLELFQISPSLHFTSDEINAERDRLENGKKTCVNRFSGRVQQDSNEISAAQQNLKQNTATISDTKRHEVHCKIQSLRAERAQAQVFAQHAIPAAYANLEAKLDLIQHWPQDLANIKQEIADGSYHNRRWGNVNEIGKRVIASGQKKDIKVGKKAMGQMKASGLMPPKLKDKAIVKYVHSVAERVVHHSDMHVPLHLTVLDSKEINAFALPGGFIFVDRGLLHAADDEAELAGVIGHEVGHVAARHGHKLMEHSTLAGILFTAAAVAGMIFTGGAAGIGTYYALEYGYQGLGLLLNLSLLGVSRDYELQADQLGIQYSWASGYDPSGFIRFFDKMATKEGYVQGAGWFHDHPPFYTRMLDAEREIMFLPKKPHEVVNTDGFRKMKKELDQYIKKEKARKYPHGQQKYPIVHEKGCSAPNVIKYHPGQSIETICSSSRAQQ